MKWTCAPSTPQSMPLSKSASCSGTKDCGHCTSRIDSVFCDLTGDRLARLNSAKTTNRYRRGQMLFYEGNQPTGLFCISSGKIKLFKTGADGKEVILRIAKPGDILGYRSIVTEQEYNLSAEVLEEAAVCFVDKTFIQHLVNEDPGVALRILKKLGDELGAVQEHLSDMLNKSVRQRLCSLLLALQRTYGKKSPHGTFLDLKLTRAEIASMVGATPETIIRLLSQFNDEGLVVLDGKKIFVKNADQLLSEAQIDA